MGNSVDCCYTTRQYNQCLFPCIRSCSYTSRRVWYNYDGLESVQPLIDIIKPERCIIHKFPRTLVDINEDREINSALKSGNDVMKSNGCENFWYQPLFHSAYHVKPAKTFHMCSQKLCQTIPWLRGRS